MRDRYAEERIGNDDEVRIFLDALRGVKDATAIDGAAAGALAEPSGEDSPHEASGVGKESPSSGRD